MPSWPAPQNGDDLVQRWLVAGEIHVHRYAKTPNLREIRICLDTPNNNGGPRTRCDTEDCWIIPLSALEAK